LYDPSQRQELREFKIEMWQGIESSILPYELGDLLNLDICYKIIHSDNCLNEMRSMGTREAMTSTVVGQTVITKYNNHPYRVMEIDFDMNPASTFETRTQG
jgi:aubergine-like protein